MQNKKRILIIVSSILILITIIGLSYAYFAANIIGNEEVSSIAGRAAYLEVTFADGADTITGNNIVPGWSASKTFTVTNTGENKTYYNLKVVNITNTFTIPGSISLSISSNDGGKNVEKMVLPASDEVIARSIPIELNGVHHYTVTAYYNNLDVDQIDDLNKTFSFDITIENATKPEPQGWSTAPEGSLLAGIKSNYPTASEEMTIPGIQYDYEQGSSNDTAAGSYKNYYWTYADGYELDETNGKFNLTGVHTVLYNENYDILSDKYLISNTPMNNCSQNDSALNTTGLSSIYKVVNALPDKIYIKRVGTRVEVTSSAQNGYWTYATGVIQVGNNTNQNGKFNLTGINTLHYSDNYNDLVGNYIPSSYLPNIYNSTDTPKTGTTNLTNLYKVKYAGSNYIIWDDGNESQMNYAEDDYGTSYYFRGSIDDNFVSFANMCWRIVRIDGKGNIKLVLYNYNPKELSNPCSPAGDSYNNAFARYDNSEDGSNGISAFNVDQRINAYIGYMYGTPNSLTYDAEQANTNRSIILNNLITWYDANLRTYNDKLADVVWCNDKSLALTYNYSGYVNTGIGQQNTFYGAMDRNHKDDRQYYPSINNAISFKCPDASGTDKDLSRFTAGTSVDLNGNGKLTIDNKEYKIGLLTADEVSYAGMINYISNYFRTNYLFKNSAQYWWTISPGSCSSSSVGIFVVSNSGGTVGPFANVNQRWSVRPAIALKPDTTISGGNGTQSNPFVVN